MTASTSLGQPLVARIRRCADGGHRGAALTTAYIHLGLGGLLFTLNGLGYIGLAVLYVIGSVAPHPLIARFSWFPRVALGGYAALTIVAWAIQGPYFPLAYFAKGVEVALIGLITDRCVPRLRQPHGPDPHRHDLGLRRPEPATSTATV